MTRKPIDRIRKCIATILGLLLPAVLMAAVPSAAQDDGEWTVVTLALDGSWGVGTSELQGPALASAVRKCSAMSQESDCGAEFTAVRRGWTLGLLCGNHRVLVAARELANADKEAQLRECDLKTLYDWSLPFCWRVITVDPDGFVTKGTRPYFAKASPSR